MEHDFRRLTPPVSLRTAAVLPQLACHDMSSCILFFLRKRQELEFNSETCAFSTKSIFMTCILFTF